MPHRSRYTLGKFLPNIPTPSNNQPSLFFGDCQLPSLTTRDLEDPIVEQLAIFEEHIGEEEEESIPHTHTMDENRNEGVFSIRETNGDVRMKNISPSAIPHFHVLTSEDPDTFLFEFFVVCKTYAYTTNDQKLNLFTSTLKDAALHWFTGLPRDNITTWA